MDVGIVKSPKGRPVGSRKRMAIVSTFDDLCGIAGYTRRLVAQLEPSFDIEVLDLDQYLMRSPHRAVQKLAEAQIEEFAQHLKSFDCVNIQLEHGTLGRTSAQILRRFKKLTAGAPELSVTFHTVMIAEPFPWNGILRGLFTRGPGKAFGDIKSHVRETALAAPIYRNLRRHSIRKPVHVIVHTRRDMRFLNYVYRLRNVHHHPLVSLSRAQADQIRSCTSRASFPGLASLTPGTKLIGTFGFLSPYKGFETVIRALKYLPDDHHLLIFGGVHPQTIKKGATIDPYIATLLKEANIGQTVFDKLTGSRTAGVNVTVDVGMEMNSITTLPNDMSNRIHFMGALDDDAFAGAMAVCDSVVVPYIEVGQSASGPISVALNMGCRVIASRTSTFMQFARYYPGAVEFFDIGNYIELSQRILSVPSRDPTAYVLPYNTETNAEVYRLANSGLKRTASAVEGWRHPVSADIESPVVGASRSNGDALTKR